MANTPDQPSKILILIGGSAGHGKDTLGAFLAEALQGKTTVKLDAFALTLKSFAHQAMGAEWDHLNGNKAIKETARLSVAGEDTGLTVRQGLQEIGEFFRQTFGKKIWANSLRLRAKEAAESVIVVTDTRHPDEEIKWMRETCSEFSDVYCVRIRNSRVPVKRGHPSEDHIADAPDSMFDFVIENEGSLEDLRSKAVTLTTTLGLVKANEGASNV